MENRKSFVFVIAPWSYSRQEAAEQQFHIHTLYLSHFAGQFLPLSSQVAKLFLCSSPRQSDIGRDWADICAYVYLEGKTVGLWMSMKAKGRCNETHALPSK